VSECDAFGSDVREVALGRTPHGALRVHLSTCSSCAATLAEMRAVLARIDATVHESVAAEPLAGLSERVLARIERAPAARAFAGWARLAASAALVAGIAIATEAFHGGGASGARSLAAWHSPTSALLQAHESVIDAPLDINPPARPRIRT
jgi:anti-sigma factor RsiW